MSKPKKLAKSLGNTFWSIFLSLVKEKTVELALKKVLGVAMGTAGFKAWFVKFIAEHFADEIVIPLLNAGLVEGKYVVHKVQGKTYIEAVRRADNVQDYNDAVDDILS